MSWTRESGSSLLLLLLRSSAHINHVGRPTGKTLIMPIRVKSKPVPGANDPPRSPSPTGHGQRLFFHGLPDILDEDSFRVLVKKLSV